MKWLARIAVLFGGLYLYYLWAFPVYSYRFRVTIEVDDNGKVYSGSGIIQSSWQYQPDFGSPVRWSGWHTGEAPFVEVGNRGILVATFQPWTPSNCAPIPNGLPMVPLVAYLGAKRGVRTITDKEKLIKLQQSNARVALALDSAPQFVWLAHPQDRKSAVMVCPSDISNAIAPGVRVKNVLVEITTDKADGLIFQRFPWLEPLSEDTRSRGLHTDIQHFELNAYDLLGSS